MMATEGRFGAGAQNLDQRLCAEAAGFLRHGVKAKWRGRGQGAASQCIRQHGGGCDEAFHVAGSTPV